MLFLQRLKSIKIKKRTLRKSGMPWKGKDQKDMNFSYEKKWTLHSLWKETPLQSYDKITKFYAAMIWVENNILSALYVHGLLVWL